MNYLRFIGYTSFAIGLINWRYMGITTGALAVIVGMLILIGAYIKPINKEIESGVGFIAVSAIAAASIIYSFLA